MWVPDATVMECHSGRESVRWWSGGLLQCGCHSDGVPESWGARVVLQAWAGGERLTLVGPQ